jgi:hypothetical protein
MTVTATAKRRRRQAVNAFSHMARIGRGNNNRPHFARHSIETLDRREAKFRERRALEALMGRKRKGK